MPFACVKNAKNFRKTKAASKWFTLSWLAREVTIFYNKLYTQQKVFCLVLAVIGSGPSAWAQLNNEPFTWASPVNLADSGRLAVELRALGFSRNNEYFTPFADGYTLFGYQVQPGLRWQPNSQVSVEAGFYARQDFGNTDLTTLRPTLQLQVRWDSLRLIFGTLEGSVEHRLIEPLYDFERLMLDRLEEGVQLKYSTDKVWADVWVDWEQMIYPGDPAQEIISGGASVRLRLHQTERSSLWLPLQFTAYHRGGQIDTSPDPLITRTNGAVGLEYRQEVEGRFLHAWRFQPYWVAYRDASTVLEQAYRDGYGIYLNATAETKLGNLMLTYWRGNEFVPIKGAPLFSSYSLTFDNPGFRSDERELIMLRLLQNIPVGNHLTVVLRLEPFYDFGVSRADFSGSIYLTYRQPITIKN